MFAAAWGHKGNINAAAAAAAAIENETGNWANAIKLIYVHKVLTASRKSAKLNLCMGMHCVYAMFN